jgi:hypothetical protein
MNRPGTICFTITWAITPNRVSSRPPLSIVLIIVLDFSVSFSLATIEDEDEDEGEDEGEHEDEGGRRLTLPLER